MFQPLDTSILIKATEKYGDYVVAKVFKELQTRGRSEAYHYFEAIERYDMLECLVMISPRK